MASSLNAQQRKWLEDLGTMVGGGAGDEGEEAGDTATKRQLRPIKALDAVKALDDAPAAIDKDRALGIGPEDLIPGLPGLGDLPGLVDKVTDRRAGCFMHNTTEFDLTLDMASLGKTDDESGKQPGIAGGKYDEFPPSKVAKGEQGAHFTAVNKKLGPFSLTGTQGTVRYVIDPQGTAWVMHFNHPFIGSVKSHARVEGPNAANFTTPKPAMSGGDDARFLFVLNAKGGTGPKPPPPGVDPNVKSSCLVTINNQTQMALTLSDQGHERGDFMTFPPTTLAPGGTATFASVETPGAKEQGCKGFVVFEVGSPMAAVWRVEWDNPENEKNTTKTSVDPQTAGLRSVDQIGQGEDNVPVVFTLSGGGDGPVPPPPPNKEVPFEPPATESKQPTLRKGDKTADGWVEYAQMQLNHHINAGLPQDGNFDSKMEAAVRQFQTDKGLQVDGIIGNQTWAALREGTPEKPSTDGRKPHTFVEEGVEARWNLESPDNNIYQEATDTLFFAISSLGTAPLDPATEAVVQVTPPGGNVKAVKMKVGPGKAQPSGEGSVHNPSIPNFRKTFPSKPATEPVTAYVIDAYLPAELGGDRYKSNVRDK